MPFTPPDLDDRGAHASGDRGAAAGDRGGHGDSGAETLHGRYRLGDKLGSGGMADVYLADDLRLGRLVAVKVLRPQFAADEESVERFRNEARAAALLSHPNIVAIHDRGHVDDCWYLVMEYVRGESLKQRLRRVGRLTAGEAAAIAARILAALQAAHERHIVHRDVTAQNVLLADDGGVKVADFGIARIGAPALTRTGMMLGTCHYVSPEQARGLPADERSDLYGAGVVLFEMLTGQVPFNGESDVAVALQHVDASPPRPRELEPAIPEALERVVLKAMAKDPAERYQTAAEFAAALDAAMGRPAAPADAAPPAAASALSRSVTLVAPKHGEAATEVRPPRRRLRRRLAAAALALGVVAAVMALAMVLFDAGIAVPDVVGQPEAQARAAVSDAGLRVVTHREYVDGVDAGVVARQRPSAGAELDDGARVDLWVSRGPLHLPAPDLLRLPAADAEGRLTAADLASARRNGRTDDVAVGEVYRQEPAAGKTVARGDTVTFWVSTGLPRVVVPDVVGLSSGDAGAELEAAGLTVSVDLTFGWGEYPDTVVEQDPAAGTKLERGAEVTISVAIF